MSLDENKSYTTPDDDGIRSSSSTPAVYQHDSKDTPGSGVTGATTERHEITDQSKVFDTQNDSAIVSINANERIELELDSATFEQERESNSIVHMSPPSGLVIDIQDGNTKEHKSGR